MVSSPAYQSNSQLSMCKQSQQIQTTLQHLSSAWLIVLIHTYHQTNPRYTSSWYQQASHTHRLSSTSYMEASARSFLYGAGWSPSSLDADAGALPASTCPCILSASGTYVTTVSFLNVRYTTATR